ncbi:glycosyltransferase family 2 protein [Brevundimonas sp.]|uniref:glycosyltransferase family 2 protein n=1 Tax=Brevundimonas sp. TaxID=1871086 RepID=UPI0025DD9A1B|nr:glycosyltransferase family 2 protein [Brevundimonas sp.]
MSQVAVVIPTLRRPVELERAIRSVFAQTVLPASIVVADNDPDGSARPVLDTLRPGAPVALIYAHAPRPGVATARNTALAATEAELIAFLDDDEVASPEWLQALLSARAALGADVVFGPIQGRAPDASAWTRAYLERFFSRSGPEADRLIDEPYGCGNALFARATTLKGGRPFDTSADASGGEDDLLFQQLARQGVRWGWAANAWVEEAAPAHRATLAYALRRAFAYGQSPSQKAAEERNWGSLLFWMCVGAGQAVVFGAVAAAHWILRRPSRADWTDRAVRGLGKLFWMKPFVPEFYGAAELQRARQAGMVSPSAA